MSRWFRSRDFAATNVPGTCLWCGRKLRHVYKTVKEIVPGEWAPVPKTCSGYYSFICGGKFELERAADGDTPPRYGCTKCDKKFIPEPRRRIVSRTPVSKKPGIWGLFCTGSCGESFGLQAAELGFRIVRKDKDENES